MQIVCTTVMWDHLTHGWDLAQALAKPYHVDDDILAVVWDFSVSFMTPDQRGPGQPLAPAVPAAPTASRLDQLMALLGRQSLPAKWTAGRDPGISQDHEYRRSSARCRSFVTR